VIFINHVKEDVDMLMAIMKCFGDATGVRINIAKSTVVPIRCLTVNLEDFFYFGPFLINIREMNPTKTFFQI
jgi:hypothetical protein